MPCILVFGTLIYAGFCLKEKMLEKREIRELLDAFIAEIRGKAGVGNYLPGDLRNGKKMNALNFIFNIIVSDLSEFSRVAHDTVTNACLQTKFKHCHNLVMSHALATSESYGGLRKTLSDLCQHTSANGSLSIEGEHSIIIITCSIKEIS